MKYSWVQYVIAESESLCMGSKTALKHFLCKYNVQPILETTVLQCPAKVFSKYFPYLFA